jgi:hypothetical protein
MQALASSIPNAVGKITGMLLEAYHLPCCRERWPTRHP